MKNELTKIIEAIKNIGIDTEDTNLVHVEISEDSIIVFARRTIDIDAKVALIFLAKDCNVMVKDRAEWMNQMFTGGDRKFADINSKSAISSLLSKALYQA